MSLSDTLDAYGRLKVRLSLMDGYPAWNDTMSENYFADLNDIPPSVMDKMTADLLKRYDKRPSVKQLREWAMTIEPPRFMADYLDHHTPRLEGPHASKEEARAIMTMLRARTKTLAAPGATCYGLQFRNKETNHVQRTRPTYSERQAVRLADERNEKWPHQETTPFKKGDPWPADASNAAPAETPEPTTDDDTQGDKTDE